MSNMFGFDPPADQFDLEEMFEEEFGPISAKLTPPADQKFQLFLKLRQTQQLAETLQQLQLKPDSERHAWIKANEDLISDMVGEFTDTSLEKLKGLKVELNQDQEVTKLSMDLVLTLRQSLLLFDNLLAQTHSLNRTLAEARHKAKLKSKAKSAAK